MGISAEQLGRGIEDKFHIQLVSPSMGVKQIKDLGWGEEFSTVEWDSPRLKGLLQVLTDAPLWKFKTMGGIIMQDSAIVLVKNN